MNLFLLALCSLFPQNEGRLLDEKLHHLGNDLVPKWTETTPEPEGSELEVSFEAEVNPKEYTLELTQRDIHYPWNVLLNGTRLGQLEIAVETRTTRLAVPAGTLKKGVNILRVTTRHPKDDIIVGKFRLLPASVREMNRLGKIVVTVRDGDSGKALPARVSVVDASGKRAKLFYAARPDTAVRPGIFYTTGEGSALELPAGDYTLTATRGMEWSLSSEKFSVRYNETEKAGFTLTREVDTSGYVAADTHIHTLTFSGHGDSSMRERMVTLAGEGVELAISTDHNHHTDYRPLQEEMELTPWFTPVVGNEVSTPIGHLNAFPMDPKGAVPESKLHDRIKLVRGIRAKGAKVVILNHPHWPGLDRGPFGLFHFDSKSGDREGGLPFTFDAIELVNSGTKTPEPLSLFEDWFTLLNRGEKITAVGSSDSHTVGYPVGQGRTYVASSTEDPSKIDVDEACSSFTGGRVSVSLGIYTDILVNGKAGMGETAGELEEKIGVELLVAAPAWIHPRRALVFLNGVQVREIPVPRRTGKPTREKISFTISRPRHDAHLVCITLGDGVTHPAWPTLHNYTLAATNPVHLDVDGDGLYRSPRETAARLLEETGKNRERRLEVIRAADDVIGLQMVSLLHAAGEDLAEILKDRSAFRKYAKYLRKTKKGKREHDH